MSFSWELSEASLGQEPWSWGWSVFPPSVEPMVSTTRGESFGAKAKTGSLRASSGAGRCPRGLGLFGNTVLAQVPEHGTYWTRVGFGVQNPCSSTILSLALGTYINLEFLPLGMDRPAAGHPKWTWRSKISFNNVIIINTPGDFYCSANCYKSRQIGQLQQKEI